jgi:hypothetical protein
VELIFGTKTSKGRISKNARISSSDSARAAITIDFNANIVSDPDTASTVRFKPSQMFFGKDTTKYVIMVENFDSTQVNLSQAGFLGDGVAVKIKGPAIKPGKTTKIEIAWKGKAPEYDDNYVASFDTGLKNIPRFSVPYTVRGTKGPKPGAVAQHLAPPIKPPEPGKPAVINPPPTGQVPPVKPPQTTSATGQTAGNQPNGTSEKSDLLKQANPDSVKADKPQPGQPWPPR